jgi:hypothetical protein
MTIFPHYGRCVQILFVVWKNIQSPFPSFHKPLALIFHVSLTLLPGTPSLPHLLQMVYPWVLLPGIGLCLSTVHLICHCPIYYSFFLFCLFIYLLNFIILTFTHMYIRCLGHLPPCFLAELVLPSCFPVLLKRIPKK